MGRDLAYEERWLDQLARKVEVLFDDAPTALVESVVARLEMGERRYGDRYLHKDMPAEAHEEAADFVAYVLLEVQKRISGVSAIADVDDLFQAAIYAAAADIYLKRARR